LTDLAEDEGKSEDKCAATFGEDSAWSQSVHVRKRREGGWGIRPAENKKPAGEDPAGLLREGETGGQTSAEVAGKRHQGRRGDGFDEEAAIHAEKGDLLEIKPLLGAVKKRPFARSAGRDVRTERPFG